MRDIKILIVEDHEDSALLLHELFKRTFLNACIEHTFSARLALNKLDNTYYDLVISDMGLKDPFVGGNSVIKKASEKGSFTVLHSGGVKERETKPDFIFPKPYNNKLYNNMIRMFKKFLVLQLST